MSLFRYVSIKWLTPLLSPKGAAGPARHVPTRARNEPGRADAVTGQTSDRRCTTKARATARLLRGDFDLTGEAALRPISRRRDGAGHREWTRVGGRRYSRQRGGVAASHGRCFTIHPSPTI